MKRPWKSILIAGIAMVFATPFANAEISDFVLRAELTDECGSDSSPFRKKQKVALAAVHSPYQGYFFFERPLISIKKLPGDIGKMPLSSLKLRYIPGEPWSGEYTCDHPADKMKPKTPHNVEHLLSEVFSYRGNSICLVVFANVGVEKTRVLIGSVKARTDMSCSSDDVLHSKQDDKTILHAGHVHN